MYDFVHDQIIARLEEQASRRRLENSAGQAYSHFFNNWKGRLPDRVQCELLDTGHPLIRFDTANICPALNAIDGNGKRSLTELERISERVVYWSMSPQELAAVADYDGPWLTKWTAVWKAQSDLDARLECGRRLADRLVTTHFAEC